MNVETQSLSESLQNQKVTASSMSETKITTDMDFSDSQFDQHLFRELIGFHQGYAPSKRQLEQDMDAQFSQQVISLHRCLEQKWGISRGNNLLRVGVE